MNSSIILWIVRIAALASAYSLITIAMGREHTTTGIIIDCVMIAVWGNTEWDMKRRKSKQRED